MTDPRGVLREVVAGIGPASAAHAEAARARVAVAGAPVLDRLAAALGGAQHTGRPRAGRAIVVCAGDHGCGDPGIALGADHPTAVAARAIADGTAALAHVARAARAPIVVVDAGAREPDHLPASAIRLGRGPSHDLFAEPALTVVDAVVALEAGIALAMALDSRPDVIALGALGLGAEVASAALLGAATGRPPTGLDDADAERAGARGAALAAASPIDWLVAFGGRETALLAGLILGAASIDTPVILDSYATGAAALVACALAPAAAGYLVASHRGSFTHPAILSHLGLQPLFDVGLGHGDGTGAAMTLPLFDQVAELAARS